MMYYYTGYSVVGWIPRNGDDRGGWRRFASFEEYKEAYMSALCPC